MARLALLRLCSCLWFDELCVQVVPDPGVPGTEEEVDEPTGHQIQAQDGQQVLSSNL